MLMQDVYRRGRCRRADAPCVVHILYACESDVHVLDAHARCVQVRQSDGGAAPAGNARGVGRPHSDASLVALCDFVYETCSSIPLAALSHPRLCQALAHVGSKGPPRFDLTGSR